MILDVLVCALWCVGILTLVWCLAGWWLLPLSGRQITVLRPDGRQAELERQLRTNAWLRAAGLSSGRVYVISDALTQTGLDEAARFAGDYAYLRVVTAAQLCERLKMEWEDDEAGRTDDSRNGTERTVSKPGKRI